jgi:hypothetical protein
MARALACPECPDPQCMKVLDPVVALGFMFGKEQYGHSYKQVQAHHLPDDALMRLAPATGGFVVELVHDWDPQTAPSLQQMGPDGGTGVVGVL